MEDRVSLYPGRVKLVPVPGQENTYDLVRADSPTQEGSPLNKNTLLKDTTAALYGMSAAAVPDEVMAWLGKYNEHWWELYHDQSSSGYNEVQTTITSLVGFFGSSSTGELNSTAEISYSKSISIDQSTGAISLVSPTSYEMHSLNSDLNHEDSFIESLFEIAPVYITGLGSTNSVYLLPAGGYINKNNRDGTIWKSSNYEGSFSKWRTSYFLNPYDASGSNGNPDASEVAKQITSNHWYIDTGETTYEHSTDRNAHPDSGTVDGITYQYLGVPFEKIIDGSGAMTGSYVGTGVYGVNNKNTITFSRKPKIVFSIPYDYHALLVLMPDAISGVLLYPINGCTIFRQYVSYNDGILSWYTNDARAEYQHNYLGTRYYYIAIG